MWDETSLFGDVVLETDSTSGQAKTSYVLAQSEIISQKRSGVSFPDYFLKDAQGSTRALVDNTGTLVSGQNYNYSAFGKLLSGQTASTATTNYLYTGQQFDWLTGLYDLRARYYTPNEGRFLSQDTADIVRENPTELNRYLYTHNNFVNFSDVTGYSSFFERILTCLCNFAKKAFVVLVTSTLVNSGLALALVRSLLVFGAFLIGQHNVNMSSNSLPWKNKPSHVTIDQATIEHSLHGDFRADGTPYGGHYRGGLNPRLRLSGNRNYSRQSYMAPSGSDGKVYDSHIQYDRTGYGDWQNWRETKTFFPDEWQISDINGAVADALDNVEFEIPADAGGSPGFTGRAVHYGNMKIEFRYEQDGTNFRVIGFRPVRE